MSETYKITTEINQTANQLTIVFEGNLDLKNINNIKDELISVYSSNNNLLLKITNVQTIDLSFIQLLISLKKELLTSKKECSIELNLNDELNNLLSNSGIDLKKIFN